MFIGATIGQEDIGFYEPLFPGNDIMRIFPSNQSLTDSGGTTKTVGVLPPWTDSRFAYCQRKGAMPFVSTKVDGWQAGLDYVKNQLLAMPSWITTLYITDRHEPEDDLGTGTTGQTAYKTNFTAFWNMINSLPATTRAKIKCGPIQTKTWTETSTSGKGNFDYSLYDPGVGDFWGVDMYEPSGTSSAAVSPSTLTTPANFVKTFAAYKFSATDTRTRIWPELGLIGMPLDTDGSARANWLQGLYDIVKTWKVGNAGWTMPWSFGGFVWWNQEGKATGNVGTIGQRRDFPLDERTVDANTATKIVPPKPLNQFNAIWADAHGTTAPPPIGGDTGGTGTGGTGGGTTGGGTGTTPVWTYWVGATMAKADLTTYGPGVIPRNGFMRIFPNTDGLPPAWDDARFAYCQANGVVPFVSSNIDGDSTKFAAMQQWIINMPSWVTQLLLTDRHEPENNFKNNPSAYITNYTAWYQNCIASLPAATRAKVMVGPVLTRQWIEGGATKGNGNYGQYDPGPSVSDFYGIDMYMDSWDPANPSNVAVAYKDPVQFLAGVKAYKYNSSDTRPRIFPELGALGIPADPTGSARAAWINGLCTELDSWSQAAQGWKFLGFAWWNNVGTGGSSLTPIGTARYFYLDKYQNSSGALTAYADPLPLKAFNTQTAKHYTATTGAGGTGTAGQGTVTLTARTALTASPLGTTATNIPPPVIVPPTSNIPASGPAAARALAAIYTILVTDPYLNVVGDPLGKWQQLQVTLRWKEPGSGQVIIPADAYVREQLQPGNRIVVLRRVLGTQHILISGPIEQLLWEKSDGSDDNAGVGKMTITFVDDLSWLGARVTYPNPDKLPEAQTADYWTYTGNPEQAMLQLVSTQAGPQALAARQVPKLYVAPYSGLAGSTTVQIVGTSDVNPREKFEKVTDVLRKICTLGANNNIPNSPVYHPDSLGFRVRQTTLGGDPILLFEPLRSRDLSGEVHFSFGKGNLKYFSYEIDAPSMTAVIVGGSGTGSEAFVREFVTPEPGNTAWGRFEGYSSESGNDTLDQMQATANQAFADTLANSRLASNAADTPDQRYGIHYNVGDIVSIELAPGQFEIAPVQTVTVQTTPNAGEVVGITIGDQSARYDSPSIAKFRELDRRLARVERKP